MGDWPSGSFEGQRTQSSGKVNISATTGSKGSYVSVINPTEQNINAIGIVVKPDFAGSCTIDVSIGETGSEQIVVPDLYAYASTNGVAFPFYLVPISISQGSKISARGQGSTAATVSIWVTLFSGGMLSFVPLSGVVAMGASGATGTDITTNGVDYGSWVQFTPSIPQSCKWLLFYPSENLNTSNDFSFDIGYGPAGGGNGNCFGIGSSNMEQRKY